MKELFNADNPDKDAIEKKMKEVSEFLHQGKMNALLDEVRGRKMGRGIGRQ